MKRLDPSVRLKVKGDVFVLPDSDGSVYFRNNEGSFRMEGKSIQQWIEILLPVFDGHNTLHHLTDGLSSLHQDRVREIAQVLYENGYVRDASQDLPHQLPETVEQHYAPQIEFLDNRVGSGAHYFEDYRKSNILAVGSGPFFVSLVGALLISGLQKPSLGITGAEPTNRQRLRELADYARQSDPEVELKELPLGEGGIHPWQDIVKPFDAVLYVSQDGDIDELIRLESTCKAQKKVFIPAVFVHHVGLAGPLLRHGTGGSFESMWRRIHESVFQRESSLHTFSSTAGALLANILGFELFKTLTSSTESELINQFYLLNLETLEGSWHPFLPHPVESGLGHAERIDALRSRIEQDSSGPPTHELFPFFGDLTNPESGIFHVWDEGSCIQLPLAKCRVQVVSPLSDGPAELRPEIICAGLTHEDARREAGLTGIEDYVSGWMSPRIPAESNTDVSDSQSLEAHPLWVTLPGDFVGVGAAETAAVAAWRGLRKCLLHELDVCVRHQQPKVSLVDASTIEDETCNFYLEALDTIHLRPVIGLGENVLGFPVAWAGSRGRFFGSVGLDETMALQSALEQLLMTETEPMNKQNPLLDYEITGFALRAPSTDVLDCLPGSLPRRVRSFTVTPLSIQSASLSLKQHGKQMLIFDLAVEPFLAKGLGGVFGVVLRQEESL